MNSQMMRVISSPSISTTGWATLIRLSASVKHISEGFKYMWLFRRDLNIHLTTPNTGNDSDCKNIDDIYMWFLWSRYLWLFPILINLYVLFFFLYYTENLQILPFKNLIITLLIIIYMLNDKLIKYIDHIFIYSLETQKENFLFLPH